jgi:single-stranded DNA-binding protein
MNICQFAGRVSEEAELTYTDRGMAKCKFKMVVGKGGSDKEFEVPLIALGTLGEKHAGELKKGVKVLVNSHFEPYTYPSKFKEGQMNTVTQFLARDILLLAQEDISKYSVNVEGIKLPWE